MLEVISAERQRASTLSLLTAGLSELRPTRCPCRVMELALPFSGPAGLPAFRQGCGRLIERIGSAAAPREIVLISPAPRGEHGGLRRLTRLRTIGTWPFTVTPFEIWPSPWKLRFIDLFEALGGGKPFERRLTDNGISVTLPRGML